MGLACTHKGLTEAASHVEYTDESMHNELFSGCCDDRRRASNRRILYLYNTS